MQENFQWTASPRIPQSRFVSSSFELSNCQTNRPSFCDPRELRKSVQRQQYSLDCPRKFSRPLNESEIIMRTRKGRFGLSRCFFLKLLISANQAGAGVQFNIGGGGRYLTSSNSQPKLARAGSIDRSEAKVTVIMAPRAQARRPSHESVRPGAAHGGAPTGSKSSGFCSLRLTVTFRTFWTDLAKCQRVSHGLGRGSGLGLNAAGSEPACDSESEDRARPGTCRSAGGQPPP